MAEASCQHSWRRKQTNSLDYYPKNIIVCEECGSEKIIPAELIKMFDVFFPPHKKPPEK